MEFVITIIHIPFSSWLSYWVNSVFLKTWIQNVSHLRRYANEVTVTFNQIELIAPFFFCIITVWTPFTKVFYILFLIKKMLCAVNCNNCTLERNVLGITSFLPVQWFKWHIFRFGASVFERFDRIYQHHNYESARVNTIGNEKYLFWRI